MATRSLTEVFILMRNNALQSRHIFSEQVSNSPQSCRSSEQGDDDDAVADDRMALVASSQVDPELGIANTKAARLPPEWVDGVEEVQYEISRIKQKMKELATLHDKHLNRPTLDDSADEELATEIQTKDITQIFTRCQNLVHQINGKSQRGTVQERKLSRNIVSSLARTLQEMSTNFRKSQSTYLRKLKIREERSQQYFDTNLGLLDDNGVMMMMEDDMYDKGFTMAQKQLVEDNSMLIHQREKEVIRIVKSIQDLNEIFKDLSSMIVDQGTILDRIDYNIENASVQVEKGLTQLQKAETHQKKSRKMLIITVLAIVVILLLLILIAVKS